MYIHSWFNMKVTQNITGICTIETLRCYSIISNTNIYMSFQTMYHRVLFARCKDIGYNYVGGFFGTATTKVTDKSVLIPCTDINVLLSLNSLPALSWQHCYHGWEYESISRFIRVIHLDFTTAYSLHFNRNTSCASCASELLHFETSLS